MDITIQTEAAVLGAVLLDDTLFHQAAQLHSDDFSLDAHRCIYSCMRDLQESGRPVDMITLVEELDRRKEVEAIGGVAYLSSLIDGVPERPNISCYVNAVREQAGRRYIARNAEAVSQQAQNSKSAISALRARLEFVASEAAGFETGADAIAALDDIPDVFTLDAEMDYLVEDLIPRGSLGLLTGPPGVGKSYIALKAAVGCGLGTTFLGRECERVKVLYLDRENPLPLVQSRLSVLAHGVVPGVHIWGGWLNDPPPMIGDPRVLKLADRNLLVIYDTLNRFHAADENSATEMRNVMAHARKLADAGATVLILHHRSKAEGSKYRGSSDILAAVDVAYSLEQTSEGLLQLHIFKSRFSGETTITLNADFANGRFEVTESPTRAKTHDDVAAMTELIAAEPGITQSSIIEKLQIGRTKGSGLLRSNDGKLWRSERGQYGSLCYFLTSCTAVPVQAGTQGTG